MGYKQSKTVRLDFPELGDDCHVIIRNPMLMSQDELTPDLSIALNDEGRPVDMEAARLASVDLSGTLIVSWVMWDINDPSEDPEVLPLPSEDPKSMSKVPSPVVAAISKRVVAAVRPS